MKKNKNTALEGHKDAPRAGAPLLYRQAERDGIAQSGEEEPSSTQGHFVETLQRDFLHEQIVTGQ